MISISVLAIFPKLFCSFVQYFSIGFYMYLLWSLIQGGIYLFKVSNRYTSLICETCSKLTIKRPERWQTLSRFRGLFWYFHFSPRRSRYRFRNCINNGDQQRKLGEYWDSFQLFFVTEILIKKIPDHWIFLSVKYATQLAFTCSKVNNRNTWKRCKICSKLTMKTPEQPHWRYLGIPDLSWLFQISKEFTEYFEYLRPFYKDIFVLCFFICTKKMVKHSTDVCYFFGNKAKGRISKRR